MSSDATVTAGRGVIYIAIAKAYFMVAGYVVYFILPRLLDGPAAWGDYSVVIGLASVIDNVIVTGTIQGVSRFTAQADDLASAVKRAALKVQVFLGGGVALAYFLTAPWIAGWEKDASLTGFFRISAGIVLCYSFYAVFVGSLNGQRLFGRQAALDIGFATIRATMILVAAGVGLGVAGAIGGFASAAAMILVVSAVWVGLPRSGGETFPAARIWQFMLKLFLYNLALNLMMRVDLFMLKRYVVDLVGAGAENPAKVASAFAGYYFSGQSLAFIPYQAVLSVAFVIFPLVSRATFDDDMEQTRAYIRQTLRLSLIFVAGVASVFIANPAAVINVPYQDPYRIAAPALRLLAGGMVCFSMFTIVNTILNGAGRTTYTILSGVVTLGLTVLANWLLIPSSATPEEALSRAAIATAGSMAVGLVLSTVLLYRLYRAAFVPLTLVRTVIAMAVAITVGRLVPEVSKLVTLGECVVVFLIYFVVLIALREFDGQDLAKIKRVIGGGRGSA